MDPLAVTSEVKTLEEQPVRHAISAASTVLVVGATRGLGLEFVRQLSARGARVIATSRGVPPPALAHLVHTQRNVSVVELDVADAASAGRAAGAVAALLGGALRLTHIVHNAGIAGRMAGLGDVRPEDMLHVFAVNAVGILNVVQAFMPLLAPPQGRILPVIAVISSKIGSVGDNKSGGFYAYRTSKTACNMICKSLSVDLAGRAAVVVLHPGYVRTDMTGGRGIVDVQESVAGMLGAVEATDATVGCRFVDYKRELIPW